MNFFRLLEFVKMGFLYRHLGVDYKEHIFTAISREKAGEIFAQGVLHSYYRLFYIVVHHVNGFPLSVGWFSVSFFFFLFVGVANFVLDWVP